MKKSGKNCFQKTDSYTEIRQSYYAKMESSCARMELSERNLPGSKQSKASAVRSRKMTKKICRLPLTSSALSDPVAGWEPISTNSHHATLKEHKKQPRFCVVLTRAGAVPVLNLREKRASNRPSVLKPFFRCFFGGGQPSGPHQSRKSQAFVKSLPPFAPFSSIVPPYSSLLSAGVSASIPVMITGFLMPSSLTTSAAAPAKMSLWAKTASIL